MTAVPPGWPRVVLPPGHDDLPDSAARWLLDLGPPELRGAPVLRHHPVALARVVAHHVDAVLDGTRRAYAGARRELGDVLPPAALAEVMAALEREGVRLAAAQREIALVEEALRGRRWRPRL